MATILQTVEGVLSACQYFSKKLPVRYIDPDKGTLITNDAIEISVEKSPLIWQQSGFQVGGHVYVFARNKTSSTNLYSGFKEDVIDAGKKLDALATNLPLYNYRKIIENTEWRKIYKPNVTSRYVWDWETGQLKTQTSNTLFACRKCGTIVEEDQIEIDHQRTKTYGKEDQTEENLWGATIKLFRYAGLTEGLSSGFKAKKLNVIGNMSNRVAKYTLNDLGVVMLSILLASGSSNTLRNIAETSIPNLRPLCGSCNKKAGEPHTKLPWIKKKNFFLIK